MNTPYASSNLNCLGLNDDAHNSNFRYADELVADQTYYIVAGSDDIYSGYSGYFSMRILMEATIPSDDYCLMNMETGQYLDIHGPDAQEKVHQWSFHTGLQNRWTFTKGADGYYTIRSKYGNQYYVGVSDTSIFTDNVCLYPSISANTQWKIYAYSSGELLIEPRSAKGSSLYVPNNTEGTELQLIDMGSANQSAKWKFEVKSDTPLEGQQMGTWCWAASARMLVNHYYDVPDARTQSNAVNVVKGSIRDHSGDYESAIYAARFYRSNDIYVTELNLVFTDNKIFDEHTLRQFINDGHVLYISRGYYTANNARIDGHATLIAGYTTICVNGNIQYRYIINDPLPAVKPDPWNSPEITTGQTIIQSYQQICNSPITSDSGFIYYCIWEYCIVVETDYSGNTKLPVYN